MMRTVDLRGTRLSRSELEGIVPRATYDVAAAAEAAGALIQDVRERGVDALVEQAERFDRVRPAALRVPAADIAAAVDTLDPAVRAALDEMIARVRAASAA